MPLLVCASFLLFVLSAVLPAAVTEPAFKCRPGEENDCSKCYSVLVANVTDDDSNIFNLTIAFFPPNTSSPAFVTVIYHYKDDFGDEIDINDTSIWFWSTSTFNLVHPLHVFQFTSLFFSDLGWESSEVHLTLHQDCRNTSEDHMRLLTQRLQIYTTRQSITSPVDESYNPKVESVATIEERNNNNKEYGRWIFSVLFLFPFFSWALLLLVISYINDIGPNPRMTKIKNILEKGTNNKKKELKYQLQNECVISMVFVLYTFILSILAANHAINTADHLHKEVSKYFSLDEKNLGLRLIYSLSFIPLVQDAVITLLMILSIISSPKIVGFVGFMGFLSVISTVIMGIGPLGLSVYCCYKYCNCCKNICRDCSKNIRQDCCETKNIWENKENRWWTFCAYSSFFSLACLINHLNYIIIAFAINLYHATSIAFIYGVVGIFIYVMVDRLPYLLQFFLKFCMNTVDGAVYLTIIFITKAGAVIILGLYVVLDGLVYYFVPIDNSFDDLGNNFLSLYHTVVVFLTAMVAYFLLRKGNQSPISIFSNARDKIENDKEIGPNVVAWKDMTEEEKDIDSAIKLWEKVIPETTIPITLVGDSNLVITPATISSENSISATDFEELEADENIKMEYQVQCRLNSLVTVVVKLENLTEHRLIIFDFNVLTSKIKAPFKLSSKEIATFQFLDLISKIMTVKGDIIYGIKPESNGQTGHKLKFEMEIKMSPFIYPIPCTRDDFSKIFNESQYQLKDEIKVTTTTDHVGVLKTSLHLQEPDNGNEPQERNEGISLYGRTTKHHVCLKCRETTLVNTNENLISIELKGSDRNFIFNLMEEIKELPEFKMATEDNRTTEFRRTRTSSEPLKTV